MDLAFILPNIFTTFSSEEMIHPFFLSQFYKVVKEIIPFILRLGHPYCFKLVSGAEREHRNQ